MRSILSAAILGLGILGMAVPVQASWLSEMAHNTSVIIAPNAYPAYPPYYAPAPVMVAPPYVAPAYVAPPVVVPGYGYGAYGAAAVYPGRPYGYYNHHHHHH